MKSRLAVVATFSHPLEAEVARTKLESMGIEAFIQDENLVSMNWLYSNAVGGVKVQVRAEDAERAREILARSEDSPEEAS